MLFRIRVKASWHPQNLFFFFFSGLSEDQTEFGKTENLGLTSATHPEKHNHKTKMPHVWLLRTQICGGNSAGYTEPWFYRIIRHAGEKKKKNTYNSVSHLRSAQCLSASLFFAFIRSGSRLLEFMLVILCQPICKQEDVRGASLHLKHFIKIFPAEITLWSSLHPRHVHTHCLFLQPPPLFSFLSPFYFLARQFLCSSREFTANQLANTWVQ